MKKGFILPNWVDVCYVLVSNGGENGCTPVVEEYEPEPDDFLSLRATMEIAGGDFSWLDRLALESAEDREKACLEADRRAAWRRGVTLACLLLKEATYRRFVVAWEPSSARMREMVCVYQLLGTVVPDGG